MADIATTGTILQGIGGFYTALDDEGREYTLRAHGSAGYCPGATRWCALRWQTSM